MSKFDRGHGLFLIGFLIGSILQLGLAFLLSEQPSRTEASLTEIPSRDLDKLARAVSRNVIDELTNKDVLAIPSDPSPGIISPSTMDRGSERHEVVSGSIPIDQAISGRLDAIESKLASVEDAIRNGVWVDPPPPASLLRSAGRPRDWEALMQLYEHYTNDPIGAVDAIRFLTYAEVLSRFGPPTSMSRDNYWFYRRGPNDDRDPDYFKFIFLNGLLANMQPGDDY